MHAGEFDINIEVVGRLIGEQFPKLAGLPIRPIRSTGTVNVIFRIGDHLYARLPRMEQWAEELEKEWEWLPRLARHISLRIPEPVALGEPSSTYPFRWAIYQWIDGAPYSDRSVADEREAAKDLAEFVMQLRSVKPDAGAPRGGRRPLRELDARTREAIEAARGFIDGDAALDTWERALEAPAWDGDPVWIHADLLRPNLLVHGGRLAAVIDFGSAGVGDPAADVIAAWSVFNRSGRSTFRRILGTDDGMWNRARGYALHQAALIIPYYRETNPEFAALARRTIEEIIADR